MLSESQEGGRILLRITLRVVSPKCHVESAVTNGQKALWIQRVERNSTGTQPMGIECFAVLVDVFRRTNGDQDLSAVDLSCS